MSQVPLGYTVAFVAAAFFVSLALTRLMIFLGPKWGLMDEPDARRVHTTAVPRAGGIAIWLSYLSMVWLAWGIFPEAFSAERFDGHLAFTCASAFLLAVGVIDDRWEMKATLKLCGQAAAALLYFSLDPSLRGFSLLGLETPTVVSAAVFIGWSVLLINAFNLIDGLDGLCSGIVLVSLLFMTGLGFAHDDTFEAVLLLVMVASVAGFIRYNFNPARIFLGDAGSMMLGFFLATSATHVGGERAVIGSLMLPIAIAGIPLLDVLLAIWRRSARNYLSRSHGGEKLGGIFSADKDHLHHRFLEMGLTQRRVALILQGFAVLLAALCFVPLVVGGRGLVIALAGFVILGLFGLRHFARVELLQTGSLMHLAIKRRRGRPIIRAMHYGYDVLALTLAGFLAMTIETNFGTRSETGVWSLNFLLLFVVLEIVALYSLRVYRRVWSRAALREFFLVALALTTAALITSSIWAISKKDVTWADFRCGFIGSQLAMWLVLLPRAFPEAIRELAVDSKHRQLVRKAKGRKQILVYGAGTRGNLFIGYLKSCAPEEFQHFQIAGFLDENPKLRGRVLQGFKIFGNLDGMEKLTRTHSLHGIMITITHMSDEAMARVFEMAYRLNLKVYRWHVDGLPQEVNMEEIKLPKVV